MLRLSGRDADDAMVTSNVGEANDAMDSKETVVTQDPGVAVHSEVDVVVEATGNPDAGARHIYQAIMAEKHVVNVTVEVDVLVGPLLKGMADRVGVVYSLVYGDQPATSTSCTTGRSARASKWSRLGRGLATCPSFAGAGPRRP